jgi:low temperature requirement protein LtrA
MQVHTATFFASSVSGVTLIICLLMAVSIYQDVQQIWQEFDQAMGKYRVSASIFYA